MAYLNYLITNVSDIITQDPYYYTLDLFFQSLHYITVTPLFIHHMTLLLTSHYDYAVLINMLEDLHVMMSFIHYLLLILLKNNDSHYVKDEDERLMLKLLIYLFLIYIPKEKNITLTLDERSYLLKACTMAYQHYIVDLNVVKYTFEEAKLLLSSKSIFKKDSFKTKMDLLRDYIQMKTTKY